MRDIKTLLAQAEHDCASVFERADLIERHHTRRVLAAFAKHGVAARHFAPSTGYGYDDVGRDTLDALYAELFHTECALVRPHIASGTHALSLCLFGLARPGEHILSATGLPYDTLHGVLGLSGDGACSLKEMGVGFDAVALSPDGSIDVQSVLRALRPNTRLIEIQRSRGYAWRKSLLPRDMKAVIDAVHAARPDIVIMVDNCYGEFVAEDEPTDYGADIVAGSLIKNPGGGLAPTGGYIAGKAKAVARVAQRLTAPGVGGEIGSYEASYRPFYQGLFLAPHAVAQAVKTAALTARACELLGLYVLPAYNAERADIVQAIRMETPERLLSFVRGIQSASPVDGMAVPEAWDMPGYDDPVVMAAGTFVGGASIELSADGPMRPPYIAYMQGGLTLAHGVIALETALKGFFQA